MLLLLTCIEVPVTFAFGVTGTVSGAHRTQQNFSLSCDPAVLSLTRKSPYNTEWAWRHSAKADTPPEPIYLFRRARVKKRQRGQGEGEDKWGSIKRFRFIRSFSNDKRKQFVIFFTRWTARGVYLLLILVLTPLGLWRHKSAKKMYATDVFFAGGITGLGKKLFNVKKSTKNNFKKFHHAFLRSN